MVLLFAKDKSSLQGDSKKAKDVALRKSDRRQLLARVQETLWLSTDQQRTLLQHIFLQGDLVRRTLILASHGDAKKSSEKVLVYYRSPSIKNDAEDEAAQELHWPYHASTQPVWIEMDHDPKNAWRIPTVALLSGFYQSSQALVEKDLLLLPTIDIFPPVSKYICRGADLMKAGIGSVRIPQKTTLSSSSSDGDDPSDHYKKNSRLVAIAIQGNPQPFAVGILTSSLEEWQQASSFGPGTQGIAAYIQTCYGDDLWKQQLPTEGSSSEDAAGLCVFDQGHYGNAGFLQGKMVAPIQIISTNHEETDVATADKEAPSLVNEDKGETTDTDDNGRESLNVDADKNSNTTTHEPTEQESQLGEAPPALTPDETLHHATCRALVHLHPKRDLPLKMAQFYSQHVLQHRPEGSTVELKKTRYKKFGAYIQEQVQQELITVGPDATKKDPLAMLTGFNARHPDLAPFLAQRKKDKQNAAASADENGRKRLVLAELYCIPNHFVSLLRLNKDDVAAATATSQERRNTGYLTSKEAKAILEAYIDREQLVNAMNKAEVILDGPLTDALYKKTKGSPPTSLTRKQVSVVWQNKLEEAFALVEMPGSKVVKLGRGAPPKVTIQVSRRQSKKFVTRVRGMEHYRINASDLRQELAQRFACAVTLEENPIEYKLPKNHVELQLQGKMVDEVKALLTGDERLTSHGGAKNSPYQIPSNALEVVLGKGV